MNTTYANPIRRLIAYWIDMTLLYAVLVGLQLGLTALTKGAIVNWFELRNNPFLTYGWIFLVISLPMWLYFILNESSPRQATLGKSLLGLRVTDLDGNRLKTTTATWRTVCKLAFCDAAGYGNLDGIDRRENVRHPDQDLSDRQVSRRRAVYLGKRAVVKAEQGSLASNVNRPLPTEVGGGQ